MAEPKSFVFNWVPIITESRSSHTFEFFSIGKILESQCEDAFVGGIQCSFSAEAIF